ncbi:MAG TPA: glycoside hydrolase family 3 C-terminal domain-containing protein [Acidimicrobiales bacterium]|nr:glycoside hydrolase family 3 C-terminal domain-containing protein [Acidimicrobiales bacterium]
MSERIENLIAELTLEEKVSLLAGEDWWHVPAVERLGIPTLKVSDGPAGVRGAHMSGGPASASFPCGTALGATWDTELVREVGVALAAELRSKGATVILAPTVNLHRTPLAGRNFECYSEDPFLTARLSAAYIDGVQSQGMATTVKHFVGNDSEFERMTISSEIPERALRELYLVPFESAVNAGTLAVMTGYNKVAGTWCAENGELIETILRGEWGFDGMVMSDWFGTHTTAEATLAGLDLEMPGPPLYRGEHLVKAVGAGEMSEQVIDERVRRVLQLNERTGVMDGNASDAAKEFYDEDPARIELLRRTAARAIVLLRNEHDVLPLKPEALKTVALVGPLVATASTQGGGSAGVNSPYMVSPLEGLRAALGDRVQIVSARGATLGRGASHIDVNQWTAPNGTPGLGIAYYAGEELAGPPVFEEVSNRSAFRWSRQFEPAGKAEPWSAHMEGTFTAEFDGQHTFSARTGDRLRLWVGDNAVEEWEPGADNRRTVSAAVDLRAGEQVTVRIDYASMFADDAFGSLLDVRVRQPVPEDLITPAVATARDADVVIVVVGMDSIWESEGHDRANIDLPPGQDELIRAVAAANPNTIVVVNAGAPVAMPWRDEVAGIVALWYLGQEAGNALADVLTGAVDAAGRLPTTFAARVEDIPAMLNYPGENGQVLYGEGLFMGYRAFDKTKIEPLFPFGFGLSYTTFDIGAPTVSSETTGLGRSLTVAVPVTNTGERAGDAVVQLYVRDVESSLVRPDKELKGFGRLHLAAGATGTVEIALDDRAFQFWDPATHDWRAEAGEFELLIGHSSADIGRTVRVVWEH